MNNPLNRVLLAWGDGRWTWTPFTRWRPAVTERMGYGPVLVHGLSGLVWAGLPCLLLISAFLGRWSAPAFWIPGACGLVAASLWFAMIRLAWNQRAAQSVKRAEAGSAEPMTPSLRAWERWLFQPLVLLAVMALAVSLVTSVENLRGAWALRSMDQEFRARGVPVSLAEVVPPPVPDDHNLAFAPMFRPLHDFERTPVPGKPGLGTVNWRDPRGFARAQNWFAIEDSNSSFSGFTSRLRQPRSPGEPTPPRYRERWDEGLRVDLAIWQAYYRSLTGWLPTHAATGASPAAEVLVALQRHDADLAELRAAVTARPECRFPIRYEDSFAAVLSHLAPMKKINTMLRLRAIALLAGGRADEAFEDVRLALRLSDALRDEPILISLLVRLAMDQQTLQPIWEGCLDHRWTEPQLAALQSSLATRDHPGAVRRALTGERLLAGLAYDLMVRRSISAGYAAMGGSDGEVFDGGFVTFVNLMPKGWIRQNQVAHFRYLQALIDDYAAARSHADLPRSGTRFDQHFDKRSMFTVIAVMLAPAVDKAGDRAFEAEAWRVLALTGLALERHRLAHGGQYPETLEALVPGHLQEVPVDPMDGRPLRYARTATGDYRLYSVGLDHRDDGGRRGGRHVQGARGESESHPPADLVWR